MAGTVEIRGIEYAIGEMPAMDQFHVARRLAPLFGSAIDVFIGMLSGGEKLDALTATINALTTPSVMQALASMKDEDGEFIIRKCLSVVTRKQDKGWAKVTTAGGTLMFQDIRLKDMLELTAHVITENFDDFFPTSQPNSDEAK